MVEMLSVDVEVRTPCSRKVVKRRGKKMCYRRQWFWVGDRISDLPMQHGQTMFNELMTNFGK